jgi:YesN/AraC family two-component response regulator
MSINKNLRILYVEDEENIRNTFYSILASIFTNVQMAVNGKDGFEKYNNNQFDLIISDINMPNMDGIEMAKKIREKDYLVSIIFISAFDDKNYLLSALQLDISGYLIKPLNMTYLIPLLQKVNQKMELHNQIKNQKTQLIDINNDLEQQMITRISEIHALNQELVATQKEVIFTMGTIGESRSKERGNHFDPKLVDIFFEHVDEFFEIRDRYKDITLQK